LKSNAPSRSLPRRMKELEKVSARIDAKMMKLEKILSTMVDDLQQQKAD